MNPRFSHSKNKTVKICIVGVLLVLFGAVYMFKDQIFHPGGLRVCPDEQIIGPTPAIDRSGETVDDTTPVRSSYYKLKGQRREPEEFDLVWVGENCAPPISTTE